MCSFRLFTGPVFVFFSAKLASVSGHLHLGVTNRMAVPPHLRRWFLDEERLLKMTAPQIGGDQARPHTCLLQILNPVTTNNFEYIIFSFPASGQEVVTGCRLFSPPVHTFIFVTQRARHSQCFVDFHRILLTRALELLRVNLSTRKGPYECEHTSKCIRGGLDQRSRSQ